MKIDISDLNLAEVLAALYNASKPQGLGFLHYRPEDMSVAARVIDQLRCKTNAALRGHLKRTKGK